MCFTFHLVGSVTLNDVFCVISPYNILNLYSLSECEDVPVLDSFDINLRHSSTDTKHDKIISSDINTTGY